ncbi:MAG: AAA family ATPase [Methanosarcinales archaeon]|nr:MAG: AAA family ATPase [Methanosarcinales archaeon]
MILKSFRIKNFRSIKDSGECYLNPNITVLAGKNESGKTNVLEGLEKLNKATKFEETDTPLHLKTKEPIEIEFCFEIDTKEIKNILKNLEIDIKLKESYNLTFEYYIIKSNKKSDYTISGELIDILNRELQKLNKKIFEKTNKTINKIYAIIKKYNKTEISEEIKLFDGDSHEEIINKINSLIDTINKNLSLINEQNDKEKLDELRNKVVDIKFKTDIDSTIAKINREIISLIPRMVLFNSFNDILPSEVPISDITNQNTLKTKYGIVEDFIKLSKLNIDALSKTQDRQKRKNIVNKASKICSDVFGKYWKQDPIEISVSYDEPLLSFFVQDVVLDENKKEVRGESYTPKQRSKGLQWYMAFFLRLKAEGLEKGNLILIDEPGLYLHAKAQKDVLELLEELSKENQIIFTTHSPYLIDPDRLARIKLLIRDEKTKETIIQNNFTKGADEDTLTPIITAIGLDLSQGIAFSKKKNIVVEGVSDYFYLQTMLHFLKSKKHYKFPEDIAIIPCVGHTKASTVVSLLIGWGLEDYKIVLDRKGTNKTYNKLIKDSIPEGKIIFVGENNSDSIEALFSKKDTDKYNLLSDELSKTIVSKKFFEEITQRGDIEFSEETIENFQELLNKIKNSSNDEGG